MTLMSKYTFTPMTEAKPMLPPNGVAEFFLVDVALAVVLVVDVLEATDAEDAGIGEADAEAAGAGVPTNTGKGVNVV